MLSAFMVHCNRKFLTWKYFGRKLFLDCHAMISPKRFCLTLPYSFKYLSITEWMNSLATRNIWYQTLKRLCRFFILTLGMWSDNEWIKKPIWIFSLSFLNCVYEINQINWKWNTKRHKPTFIWFMSEHLDTWLIY